MYKEVEPNLWETPENENGVVQFIDNRHGVKVGSVHMPSVRAFEQRVREEFRKRGALCMMLT